jgi:hypothetical protein
MYLHVAAIERRKKERGTNHPGLKNYEVNNQGGK